MLSNPRPDPKKLEKLEKIEKVEKSLKVSGSDFVLRSFTVDEGFSFLSQGREAFVFSQDVSEFSQGHSKFSQGRQAFGSKRVLTP